MEVPLLDLRAQYRALRPQIRAALDRVCDAQQFVLGPEVAALEAELAPLAGVRHAVAVSSGTDALLAALMAIGVGPDDEVVTTPYSFFATAGVIARLGARPVFADIDPATCNLDPAAALARITPRTRAVVPVHLFGRCAELDPLLAAGPPVIEDAAQALGAHDGQGRPAGGSGRIGCFSFFPTKNLGAFGDGGLAVTSVDGLADTLRLLRAHGSRPKYHHHLVGGNFRLDAVQAAVLRVKLPHLPEWNRARRFHAALYRTLFDVAGLLDRVQPPADAPGHVYHQYVIRCPDRDGLRAHLARRGVGTEVYYPVPLHLQPCFRSLGHRPGDFPHAEAAAAESLALPVYPELAAAQQQYVVQAIADYYGGQG